MSISRFFVFALLGPALVANARADEWLDDSPPVPPATAAAMAESANSASPRPSAPAATPAFTPAPPPRAPNALPQAAAPTTRFAPEPDSGATDGAAALPAAEPVAQPASLQPSAAAVAAPSKQTVAASALASGSMPDADHRRLQLAALAGIGTTFDHTPGGVNPLGFGFGLRGDFRVFDEFAFGARVLYFVGGASELPTGKIDMTSWLLSTEASYVLDLDPVLVEPGVLVGVSARNVAGRPAFTGTMGQAFVPGSQNQALVGVYIAPGVNVVVPLSIIGRELAPFFLGADARLDVVFVRGVSSNVQLLVQGGLRL